MHQATGKFFNEDDRAKQTLAEQLKITKLTDKEYLAVKYLPEEDRPAALALSRFVESRTKLGARVDVAVKNAFRLGFQQGRDSK